MGRRKHKQRPGREENRRGTAGQGRTSESERRSEPSPSPSTRVSSKRGAGASLQTWGWGLAVVGIAGFYLILKAFSLNAYAGDEYIYLYQGKLVSDGVVPYASFAMAHPPLQALFTALIFKIFGIHFLEMRLLPILWCLSGGIGLAVLVRRELGGIASTAAVFLYLTAHEPLRASSHFTGVNMTVSLMIFSVLAYRADYIKTAALLSVAAVFTRLYAAPGVLAMTLFALASDRRKGLRLVVTGAVGGVILFVAFGIWTGFGDMAHNIFAYHADKTPMSDKALAGMRDSVLFHNAGLVACFAVSIVAAAAVFAHTLYRSDSKGNILFRYREAVQQARLGLPILCIAIAGVFLLLLLNMNRVWMYYYIPAFPFAAVSAGWMISGLITGAVRLVRARGRLEPAGLTLVQVVSSAVAILILALAYHYSPRLEARLAYFERAADPASKDHVSHYNFPPSPLPPWLNDLVRDTLWSGERVIGRPYSRFNYYLWHESRTLDIAEKAVDTIKKNTTKSGEIFGDSGTVPLFALLSGRDIAAHEADTNIQRYRSGNVNPIELISKIDNYKTEMIILRRGFGVYGVPELLDLVKTKYRKLTELRSAQGRVFQLFKRKKDLSYLREN